MREAADEIAAKEIEMQMFKMNRMVAVAMMSCLPIACGSSSPTGPDLADLESQGTGVSALGRKAPSAPSVVILPSPEPPTNDGGISPPNDGGKAAPVSSPEPMPSPEPPPNDGGIPPTNDGGKPGTNDDGTAPSRPTAR